MKYLDIKNQKITTKKKVKRQGKMYRKLKLTIFHYIEIFYEQT